MKLWIARDKNGDVNLFQEKPFLSETFKHFYSTQSKMKLKQTNNNRTFLKHITFENSPQEVELNLLRLWNL